MRSFHKRYDYIIRQLQLYVSLRGKVVVDCGCGDGDGTIHFSREGCKTVGVDISKRRIKTARAAFPGLDFRSHSILSTGLPDEYADIFVCSETLEHLTRAQSLKAANEISRTCKLLSHVCITVPANKKVCLEKKGHKQYLSGKVLIKHFVGWELLSNTVFYKNPANTKRGNRVMIFGRDDVPSG